LTNSFNNSTQATFQMLEGIVTAFGGFAQMLESTYMATHSSFFGKLLPIHWSKGLFTNTF
jgi:peroxin-13